MKKTYLFSALLFSVSGAFAQQYAPMSFQLQQEFPISNTTAGIAAMDTLGLATFGTQFATYFDTTGGVTNYIFGTFQRTISTINVQNHEVAAGFVVNENYNVEGAMMVFGKKANLNPSPADLNVKLYSLAEDKALGTLTALQSGTADAVGPDAVLKTAVLPFASVNAPVGLGVVSTIVDFPSSTWVNGDFAIALELAGMYPTAATLDTVALTSNSPQTTQVDGTYSWLKQVTVPAVQPAAWVSMAAQSQPLQIAIFAIVAESLTGIEEQGFINGVKLTTYPNPAVSSDNVRIDYALAANTKSVVLNIFDMNGKLVSTIEEGTRNSGIHTVNVPAGTLSAGSYIYAITADNNRIAKRMEVIK